MTGLVVFDLDGTLIDSMGVTASTFASVASQAHPEVSYSDALSIYTQTAGAPLGDQFAAVSDDFSETDIEQLDADFFASLLQKRFDSFSDVASCIADLVADGWILAVSSGSSQESVDKKLQDAGLADNFVEAFGSNPQTGFVKGTPHIDAILASVDRPVDPNLMVFVGDTDHDIEIAHKAGFHSVAIDRGAPFLHLEVSSPDLVINDLAVLAQLLDVRAKRYSRHEKGEWTMGYKVNVDFDLCESNAVCMDVAPEVFEVRDDDFLYVLADEPEESLREKVVMAAERCPKQAISITEL